MGLSSLAALLAVAVQMPVSSVTVYSDRARVVRSGVVQVQGEQKLELPLLDDRVDASTIQLEAAGGSVVKIDIAHIDEQDFPRGEARDLLSQLEKLDDKIAQVNGADAARRQQLQAIQRVTPGVKLDDNFKPLPKLTGAGWAAAMQFIAGQEAKLQEAVRASHEELFELHREREKLAVRASQIGGARRISGHRVSAVVNGDGAVKLTLTYRVLNARWTPSYDVQFLPDKGEAQVSFSGLVSQESGEDWTDAMLTLSTAVPASSTQYPKLLSWKLGERERFIPTPAPQPPQPIPAAPEVPAQAAPTNDDEILKQRLTRVAQGAQAPADLKAEVAADEEVESKSAEAPPTVAEEGAMGALSLPPPSAPPSAMPGAGRGGAMKKSKRSYPRKQAAEPMMAAPKTAARPVEAPDLMANMEKAANSPAQVGLSPPPAYLPPSYDSTLPASLAGGYDLAFDSARRETIKSGEGARRVPLFGEIWPVTAERVLYPALAPEAAFLVAQIKNSGERILPGGPAALAVGNDPAGTAQLKLVSAGETFTLPLGLDRALKPIRNVNLVTEEKGFIGKDEITHYVVTIELANPYKKPIPVRIIDQIPLQANKEVELQLEKIDPKPQTQEKETGKLEWALTLPASGKQVVSFTYSVRRPKGYRLYQEQ